MLIIPAIDLKDGCVVRFVQGHKDKKVYSKDPIKTARHWWRAGSRLIHIVDLDGAATGIPSNLDMVKQIAKTIATPIQFGGGIRKVEMIKKLLEAGIYRIVLGTKAIEDKAFLKKVFHDFKERVIVSIDTREGNILIKGWQSTSGKSDTLGFIHSLKEIGFKRFIYTDVSKDGTLNGPNIKDLKMLLKETGMKIIASGGISSLNDISRLKLMEKQGLEGIIIGKALYEGRFTLSQALKLT